jgi:dihydrodipicolinate synthase/N-acetylneuraminate lyase
LLVRLASSALSGEAALARALREEALPAVKAVFSAKNPIPLAMLFNSHLRSIPRARICIHLVPLFNVFFDQDKKRKRIRQLARKAQPPGTLFDQA